MNVTPKKNRGGSAIGPDLMIVIGLIIALWVFWFTSGGPAKMKQEGGGFFPQTTSPSSQTDSGNKKSTESRYQNTVKIQRGTDSYEYYPQKEYIVLEAAWNNKEAVNISGWKLSDRGWPTGKVRVAVIPRGTETFKSTYQPANQNIKLEPGERAIITTGRVVTEIPFAIKTSFKINKCSGYLQNEGHFQFYPYLYSSCPRADQEIGAENLDKDCYNFLKTIGSCQTVKFDQYNRLEYIGTRDVLDDENFSPLTASCQQFMRSHLNYDSCVDNHKKDKDFLTKEWRVFLFKTWDMWAEDRETIKLLDASGKLVDSLSY